MKNVLIILFSVLLLLSCKAQQNQSIERKAKEDISVQHDLLKLDTHDLSVLTDQIIRKMLNEQLNININQKKYNTDKPVNAETGLHPLEEENDINITKQTEETEETELHQEADSTSTSLTKDQGTEQIENESQDVEKQESKFSKIEKTLLGFGLMVVGVILFFGSRFLYRIFKK